MLPIKFLEISSTLRLLLRLFLRQKQSGSSYIDRGVLHPFFWLSMYAFAKPADFQFQVRTKVGRTAGG